MDCLVDRVDVDLVDAVALDRDRNVFDELIQPRLMIAGNGFRCAVAFGLGSHSGTIPPPTRRQVGHSLSVWRIEVFW